MPKESYFHIYLPYHFICRIFVSIIITFLFYPLLFKMSNAQLPMFTFFSEKLKIHSAINRKQDNKCDIVYRGTLWLMTTFTCYFPFSCFLVHPQSKRRLILYFFQSFPCFFLLSWIHNTSLLVQSVIQILGTSRYLRETAKYDAT